MTQKKEKMITICCASACAAYSTLTADAETNKAQQIKKFDWQQNSAKLKKIANQTSAKLIKQQ
ncbi:MAG TPA: hypothetical protein DEV81_12240 [Cyanobacteria bacterium UBA11049]|nr:hypothetical protein [Cyanobacteria bacterium UBA11049]